ncbi:MAG: pilin [Patescibacteria group bacterium]
MYKKIFLLVILFFLLVGNNCSAAIPIEVPLLNTPNPTLPQYIAFFFWWAIVLGGVLAVLSLVFNGIKLIISAGSPTGISEAKDGAKSAILGLVLLLSSYVLIITINPGLKNLQYKEQLKHLAVFQFGKSSSGTAYINPLSGCGIGECLGSESGNPPFSCSSTYCGGYNYSTGCQSGECPGSGGCSASNCISSFSGCPVGKCQGPGGCSVNNCNSGVYEKPAPLQMENLEEIKKEYGVLKWNALYTDLSGNTISNCDPNNPNAVYLIYFYGMPNYNNFIRLERVRCGQMVPLGIAKSYKIIKEIPGVYFFDGPNCFPQVLSKYADLSHVPHTESIPGDIGINGTPVKSIRIVNGSDFKKGPFYGMIYFNSTDYRTGEDIVVFQRFIFSPNEPLISTNGTSDNYSRCFNVALPSKGVSFAIYQWVGFNESGGINAGAGNGITLFSEVSWNEGKHQINPGSAARLLINLSTIPIDYPPNTKTPKGRRDVCRFFNPAHSCLKSFEIKGNYLVMVYGLDNDAQVFPISSRLQEVYKNRPQGFSVERGTPEINSDYIGSKSAYYMEIIPLTVRLR